MPLTPAPLPEKNSLRCMTREISKVAKELCVQRKCNTGCQGRIYVRPLVMFYFFEG